MSQVFRAFWLLTTTCLLMSACAEGDTEPAGIAESEVVSAGTSSDDQTNEADPSESSTSDTTASNSNEGDSTSTSEGGSGGASETGSGEGGLAASSASGIVLEAVQIEREGTSLTVRFSMSNQGSSSHVWSYQLSSALSAPELGLPTGVTIIDPASGTQQGVLRTEDKGCVCSQLATIASGATAEYFATFDAPDITDFELYIPTFPLLPVSGDLVGPPRALDGVGVAPASTDQAGLTLDVVAAHRLDQLTAIEFTISNPATTSKTWTYELSANLSATELAYPTGVTVFDPASQAIASPVANDESVCVCSRLSTIPAGGTATYFALIEGDLADTVTITIPGFPQVTGVPVNS